MVYTLWSFLLVGWLSLLKPQHHDLPEGFVRIQILENLTHRGACGCDPETGDGAGILIQMPDLFFRKECKALHIETVDKITAKQARDLLATAPGVTVVDERAFLEAAGYRCREADEAIAAQVFGPRGLQYSRQVVGAGAEHLVLFRRTH